MTVERGDDAAIDDDDSLFAVEGDEEEEQDIEIDNDVSYSSDKVHADDDDMSNSFDTLHNKFMSIWYNNRSKLIHDCTQVGW